MNKKYILFLILSNIFFLNASNNLSLVQKYQIHADHCFQKILLEKISDYFPQKIVAISDSSCVIKYQKNTTNNKNQEDNFLWMEYDFYNLTKNKTQKPLKAIKSLNTIFTSSSNYYNPQKISDLEQQIKNAQKDISELKKKYTDIHFDFTHPDPCKTRRDYYIFFENSRKERIYVTTKNEYEFFGFRSKVEPITEYKIFDDILYILLGEIWYEMNIHDVSELNKHTLIDLNLNNLKNDKESSIISGEYYHLPLTKFDFSCVPISTILFKLTPSIFFCKNQYYGTNVFLCSGGDGIFYIQPRVSDVRCSPNNSKVGVIKKNNELLIYDIEKLKKLENIEQEIKTLKRYRYWKFESLEGFDAFKNRIKKICINGTLLLAFMIAFCNYQKIIAGIKKHL